MYSEDLCEHLSIHVYMYRPVYICDIVVII